MKSILLWAAPVALAATALAQPASFTDLGTHTATETFNTPVTLIAANDVQWFKIVLPTVAAADGYVDIWTSSGGALPITDTEIGIYTNTGAFRATDDDDDAGNLSALTFGQTAPTRPANGTGLAFNGRDGILGAGTYWVAVGAFNTTFNATGWSVTSTSTTTTRTTVLNFRINPATLPTNPTGIGSATPATGQIGQTFVAAVTVSPGANPASTGLAVTLDTANVDGGGVINLLDDGNAPDAAAGDNIFSANVTVGALATGGVKALPFNISDAQARAGTGNIAFTVTAPPAAFTDLGTHTAAETFGQNVTLASLTDIQWFKIVLPATSASNGYVDIWTGGGDITDTEIGIFDNSGALIANDDDSDDGLLSALSFGLTAPTRPAHGAGAAFAGINGNLAGGTYWIAVGRFNVTFAAGWIVTSTNTTAQTTTVLNFAIQPIGSPTNPSGVGVATPNSGTNGVTFVAAVTVTPGQFPASTGLSVKVDGTNVDASPAISLLDNGVAPDAVAGDNIFSANITVGALATPGAKTLAITVSDLQGRIGNSNMAFTVTPPPPSNDECVNAIAIGEGTVAWNNAAATDSAQPNPTCSFSSPANFHKDIWYLYTPTVSGVMNVGTCGTNQDTVIAIYDTCGGTELACDDDSCDGVTPPGSTLASFIGNFNVSAGVPVVIRVGSWGTTTPAGGAGQLTIGLAPTTNPTGVGSATPNSGVIGATFVAAVTVTPGGNPASTGLAVTLDTTNVDGGGVINLLDDGNAPDAVAGDNIFSANVTVGAGATGGVKTLPFSITDAETRSGSGNITFTVAAAPGTYTDLGTHTATESFTTTVTVGVGEVQWFKIVLPPVTATASYVDIFTSNPPDPNSDSELGIYDSTGALIATDDDGSDGLLSQLSHGLTAPARPANGLGDLFAGQDGALTGGVYWLAVGNFNTTFANGWAATSTSLDVAQYDLTFNIAVATNPSGVGSATPNNGAVGATFVATVAVTGGTAPASTGIAVSLDASLVNGGTVALLDDGVAPDAVAGDGIYSGNVTVGAGASAGLQSLPATISDAEGRMGSANVDFTVTNPCVGDINGDGQRNLTDLAILLSAFGTNLGDGGYIAAADLNGDNSVGLTDLATLLSVFGSPCP